ncbi:MAG: FecR domain-containing protein [Myxococcota bacterium]
MSEENLLKQLGAETAPTPSELDAVRRGLARRISDGEVSVALLRHLPDVRPEELVRARAVRPRRWSPWLLAPLSFGAGMAMATALLGAWLALRPDRVVPLSGSLASTDAETVLVPAPGVSLTARGAGDIGGTSDAPRIDWTGGSLAVEVEPERGIDLVVETREARVRVVGTVFSVDRDALGTSVGVTRGKVEVTCAGGRPQLLGAGERVTCLPNTAPGLLGRANALKAANAAPADVLAAVDAGLPIAQGPYEGELRAVRAEMLLQLDRPVEAVAEARRYLALDGPRQIEVAKIGVSAAMASGGCEVALPFLQDLERHGAADPDLLLDCEGR